MLVICKAVREITLVIYNAVREITLVVYKAIREIMLVICNAVRHITLVIRKTIRVICKTVKLKDSAINASRALTRLISVTACLQLYTPSRTLRSASETPNSAYKIFRYWFPRLFCLRPLYMEKCCQYR